MLLFLLWLDDCYEFRYDLLSWVSLFFDFFFFFCSLHLHWLLE